MPKYATALTCSLAIALYGVACGETNTKPATRDAATRSVTSAVSMPAPVSVPLVHMRAPMRPGIEDAYDGDDGAFRGTEEGDDVEVQEYGKPSDAAEIRAARAFVGAYFGAALREDGAAGCALLEPAVARDLGGSYEKPGPQHYLQGKTCPEVMRKLFVHRHRLIVAEASRVEITAVRHTPGTMFVLLAFRGVREPRMMGIAQLGSDLRLEAVQDSPYP